MHNDASVDIYFPAPQGYLHGWVLMSSPGDFSTLNEHESSDDIVSRASDTEIRWRPPNIQLRIPPIRVHPEESGLENSDPIGSAQVAEIRSQTSLSALDDSERQGRDSVGAFLDRLELMADKPLSVAASTGDSVLLTFDPLIEKLACSVPAQREHLEQRSTPTDSSLTGSSVTHLVSPLPVEPITPAALDSTSPMSTGFTPALSTTHYSTNPVVPPSVFSPWIRHSILDQALGGVDRSPEWSQSSTRNITSDNSVEQIDLDDSYTSATDASSANELNILAEMLERVNVHETPPPSFIQSDELQYPVVTQTSFPTTVPTPAVSNLGLGTTPTNAPINVQNAPGTYKLDRKLHELGTRADQDPPCMTVGLQERIVHTPVLRLNGRPDETIDKVTAIPTPRESVLKDGNTSMQSIMDKSGRLSMRSISGMVSQVAYSLYDRLGSVSQLTSSVKKLTRAISEQENHLVMSPLVSTPKQLKSQKNSDLAIDNAVLSEQPTNLVHARPSSRSSMDEDVWESVNSTQDHNKSSTLSLASTPTSTAPSMLHTEAVLSEDKENIPSFQSDAVSGLQSLDHVRYTSKSVGNLGSPLRSSGLHEKQSITYLTGSGDGPETRTDGDSILSKQEVNAAQEWSSLNDEVFELRNTVNDLSSVMLAYENVLVDAETSEHRRNVAAVSQLFKLAQERDEAMDQAVTMYKAYEDMLRRVQRAKETIELKRNKQIAATKMINQYNQKLVLLEEKKQKLTNHFLGRLGEAFSEQEQQRDVSMRKLDQLQLNIRQYELKNASLLKEIEQVQSNSDELVKMSQLFFQ
ncbi:hypothetical protein EG68_06359 [Paragonimus skrjabini miyazakii]|uniref:Transforming acidic coiled-coil-containing protein C-terminal domain-containing protein n=1 Tax=Paragonimus skrjabini miyazakii TaxID=59628 RepID=A0A8S9YEE7_9TREM|nr:hypothetical protein EG68_06359 [Paragonimus skrjabini miyazakii]